MMKRWSLVIAILFLAAFASIYAVGWSLVRPVQASVGHPPSELNARPVSFPSDSGATVQGWWCSAENSHGAVLLLPGIRANRLSMIGRARFLFRSGYSVLLIDFQATGETQGECITLGWKESRDVIAAVDFIHRTAPAQKVAIIGSSLGGAAALLATPPLKVDGLVLEEVYPTIEIATRNRMENYLGPTGRALTPLLLQQLYFRLGVSASQFHTIDHIADVRCPVLIMSGEKDKNTRPADTQILFERARSPKELWFVPGAGHVDLHRFEPQAYERRVLAFLARMTESP